jgi:pilus assembly protein Flp/PilA
MNTFLRLWSDDSGAELTEYSLVLGVIAVGLIAALVLFRDQIVSLFDTISSALEAAPPSGS